MSNFIINDNTIDLIAQAAYKTKVITKASRTLFGQQLRMANLLSEKAQEIPVTRLTDAVVLQESLEYRFAPFPRKYKRLAVSGAIACWMYNSADSPGYEDSEILRLVTRVADRNALQAGHGDTDDAPGVAYREATATVNPFYDISDAMRDPESDDYENIVMVRPIDVIREERMAEAERIREERMATVARLAEAESDDSEDEDEDWDLEDEDEDAFV